MDNIHNLIRENKLYSEYQPLIKSDNEKIFAYEALMRTTPWTNPLTVFEQAREHNLLFELDTVCIMNAIKGYPKEYLSKHLLFINIFPSTVIHDKFESFLKSVSEAFPKLKNRIVFEINETENEQKLWWQTQFLNRLVLLKRFGYSVAFDDLSISKASLKKLELLTPDFVKLDHTKGKDLSQSVAKQQLISLFLEYTNEKMKLVLEGIEEKADLEVARKLGVPLLQGYYISKPKKLS
ncbi:EAL domain-containing protein [Lysinibacillus sp. BW-2-10]|uniref:EAL domain-containing protein n=1 Tax=Lysinibacillus sp. BW-2-10 TaxID=2590030 RepID=UPI0011815D13|nr:EAL domain-containing protein [Lysinibacillus sp. BW-2-10]TSI04493.1 EAL domain-containing protein [Lysinibacillus sp. BW-2-10]